MAKLRDTSRPSDSTNDMKQSSWSTLTTPCRKELITRRERERGGDFFALPISYTSIKIFLIGSDS